MKDFGKIRDKLNYYMGNIRQKFSETVKNIKHINMDTLISEKNLKVGLSLIAVSLIAVAGYSKTIAYDIHIGNESLGIVRKEEVMEDLVSDLEQELSDKYKMDIVLGEDLSLEKVHVLNGKISQVEDLKKNFRKRLSFLVKAYSLEIDGQEVGALKTKEEVEAVIDKIKAPYEEEALKDGKLEEIHLLEQVRVKKADLALYKLMDQDQMIKAIKEGGRDVQTHTVEVGETLWTIAKMYDTTMEDLIEANPDGNPDKLQIGDQVKLIKTKTLLTVATTSEKAYEETIEFESEVELNDKMYNNEKEIKKEGKNGRTQILAKEVRHNGKLISKDIVEEKVLEEPVNQLVVKGTKEVPKTRATGSLAMATRGRISSRYGSRNGRMHKGLDISASVGTPIYAADGGRVVSAGWSGAYGYLVEVDHENGYKTKYAHCSKILVKPGTRVYKGQEIAKVGNTGRSTGPHLHIEVLKNGRNVNPSSYLN